MEGALKKIIVIGGQGYEGPTAIRDKKVVEKTAKQLFNLTGNSFVIVTGGMPGIPDDFARAWKEAGGKHVQCLVSSEYEEAFKLRNTGFDYIVVGESQLKRRLALTQLKDIHCVLAIQGGKYTTHELQLFEENGTRIKTFWGSGGASGGKCPYDNGYVYTKKPVHSELLCTNDVDANVDEISQELVMELTQ